MKPVGKSALNKKAKRTNDPIRIVPLHLPIELYRPSAGIAAPPAAQLTYRGGPLLDSVKVFTIFWGTGLADKSEFHSGKPNQPVF